MITKTILFLWSVGILFSPTFGVAAQGEGPSSANTSFTVSVGAPSNLKAQLPSPANGACGVVVSLLRWTKGDTAVCHNVYFGTTPDLTETNLVAHRFPVTIYYHASGLQPGVTYYWRVDEIDAGDTIITGDVWWFVAAGGAPQVSTLAPSAITETSATLAGRVECDAGGNCQYRFRYRQAGGAYIPTDWTGSVITGQTFSSSISGLTPGTQYNFAAQVKTSASESDWGEERTFTTTTTPASSPQVLTLPATEIGLTSARLNGRIVQDGGEACQHRFTYWPDGGSTTSTSWQCCARTDESFTAGVSDLRPNSTYHFQAEAKNSAGTRAGSTESFAVGCPGPHILRIENVHAKLATATFTYVLQEGASEKTDDAADQRYLGFSGGNPPVLVSRVLGGIRFLTVDARGLDSTTAVYPVQALFSNQTGPTNTRKDTNLLLFSFPQDQGTNGAFGPRLITFQEYIPQADEPNIPEPNAPTFPIYDVRALIADGNGVGVMVLPNLAQSTYPGTLHSFILRTDKVSIADFNDDRVVDANDYRVIERDLGKIGNSMGDIASLKDGALVIGIPDGKVDETDVAAFEQEKAAGGTPGGETPPPQTPPDSSVVFAEGFEGALYSGWSNTGSLAWQATTSQAHGGSRSIRAGAIGHNQTSSLTLQRFCKEGRIQFWRKVSCEAGSDVYRFFIGGVQQEQASGEADWRQVSFPLQWPGTNTFEWRYEKNGSVSSGADTVWIDDVEITVE